MVIDAFLYAGELECLEMRVREYEGLVDRHLVIEGTQTFVGDEREVTPLDTLRLISPLIDQAVFSLWSTAKPFEREAEQRNSIKECVMAHDRVLVSDVDEIVRRECLEAALITSWRESVVAFDLNQYYYRLNLLDEAEQALTARLVRGQDMGKPQNLRSLTPRTHERVIRDAGWHFGWLGSVPKIQRKLKAFAHQELNTPELTETAFLEGCIRTRHTIHNGHLLTQVPIDDSFPRLVRENPQRFEALIAHD
jgi:hypothetical protein